MRIKVYTIQEIEFQTFLLLGKTLIVYSVMITTLVFLAATYVTVHFWPLAITALLGLCGLVTGAIYTALEMQKMVKRVVDGCYFQSDDEDFEDIDEKQKDDEGFEKHEKQKNKPRNKRASRDEITTWLYDWLIEEGGQPVNFIMNQSAELHSYGLDYDDMTELFADIESEFGAVFEEDKDFTVKELIDLIIGEQL